MAVRKHVAVIGAGVVGLGIAYEALRRGHQVTVVDPSPAAGATFAAAGMLAPVSEHYYQEEQLLALTTESARLYPAFLQGLGPTGHQTNGTLVAGFDAGDRLALEELRRAQLAQGLQVQQLTSREARRLEPGLSPALAGAFLASGDHQIDPRALAAALLAALAEGGAALVRRRATAVVRLPTGEVSGVVLDDGTRIAADETVVANALAAPELDGLPESVRLPLRPVYGDILRLRVPPALRPLVQLTVRGLVRGLPVYLVPREDGTVVIGATSREDGSDAPSAGGVYQLLRDAQALVPAVSELQLEEATCRARPGTPDNAPLLGRITVGGADLPGLLVATGFFRHGVLLTPVAARICADLIDGMTVPAELLQFRPDRFSNSMEGSQR
ncbi:glycine oxidase ThiO [Arthrobacter crystallopoietes BAB-32]|uniref:glycine oxidase n=1 Tax=Arthrobacter crystallopoietes BAB-32 TaxID=1246476 RepID=N1URP4_9MICC|nr:glycine oxidase ThiO [Arthrobacter crystallopoietes BAB-32]